MFPIRNIKGDTIAFGGRLLKNKEKQAKYLNSPKTKTYNKTYELYGLYDVRQKNKRPDSIFVVEGYMDVVGLYQHGIQNAGVSIRIKNAWFRNSRHYWTPHGSHIFI